MTKSNKKKFNPHWLACAVVYTGKGERFGTVRHVEHDGDTLCILSRGIKHVASAAELDKAGRLKKPRAIHSKFL